MALPPTLWKKQAPSAKLLTAANMPELYHTMPGKDFDPEKSECLQWIAKQPELLLWLFDLLRRKGLVEFDQDARTWRGKAPKKKAATKAKTTKSRTERRATATKPKRADHERRGTV